MPSATVKGSVWTTSVTNPCGVLNLPLLCNNRPTNSAANNNSYALTAHYTCQPRLDFSRKLEGHRLRRGRQLATELHSEGGPSVARAFYTWSWNSWWTWETWYSLDKRTRHSKKVIESNKKMIPSQCVKPPLFFFLNNIMVKRLIFAVWLNGFKSHLWNWPAV